MKVKVRISVGNLAPRFVVAETGEAHFLGILNRKALEKGRRMVGAVGGAAELTSEGKALLESHFGATEFERLDARFIVDEGDLEAVLGIFESRDSRIYETDAAREIAEELATKELPIQNSPVLSAEEVAQIEVNYVKTLRQKSSGGPGSARESVEVPTRRLFNIFEVVVPATIFEKIKSSPAIYILSEEEIASTEGGSRKGKAADGAELADNLLW